MPGNAENVVSSKSRALVEQKVLKGMDYEHIAQDVALEAGDVLMAEDIQAYDEKYIKAGKALIAEVVEASKDLGKLEVPPADELDILSSHFSFKKTNEDLNLIYARIRELNTLAQLNPSVGSYDARISEYIKRAEGIRERIFKSQFEDLRRAVLANIGKKIVVAAIGILMPYIDSKKRDEAKRLFMAAIEPLINCEMAPPEPTDVVEIKDNLNGQ